MLKNKFVVAILSGALCALAFAPFYVFVAAIFSLSLLFFLLEKNSAGGVKTAAQIGFCYGFGYFLAGIYWISISLLVDAEKFAWLVPFALTLIPAVLALYFAGLAACYHFVNKKFPHFANYQKVIIFSLLWLVFEMLRSVLFTGFPWNLLGYSLMFSNSTMQVASVFSVYGLTLLVALFCLTPALFFKNISIAGAARGDKIFATLLIILFAGNFIFGYYRLQNKILVEDYTSKLRLVQGNIKQDLKWDPAQKYRNFLKQFNITNSANKAGVKLVIWSETAVPYIIDDNAELLRQLQLAVPQDGALITGALRAEYDGASRVAVKNVWNSVFAIGPSSILAHYDKHHLVPFGEYIPFAKYLPFIEKITDGAVGFGEGEGPQTIMAQGFSFSPLVCYEIIFPNKIIDKNNRPNLLVNVTNDAWFGSSTGPYQHFDMSKMRAVEYGISLARVANTGITGYINPLGQEVARINLNETGFIDVNFINKLDETIFSRFNFWPLGAMILALLLLLLTNFHHKNAGHKKIRRG